MVAKNWKDCQVVFCLFHSVGSVRVVIENEPERRRIEALGSPRGVGSELAYQF